MPAFIAATLPDNEAVEGRRMLDLLGTIVRGGSLPVLIIEGGVLPPAMCTFSSTLSVISPLCDTDMALPFIRLDDTEKPRA